MRSVPEGYLPMQNFEFIDNQLDAESVVEMWYTKFVNNFFVTVQIRIIGLRQCCWRFLRKVTRLWSYESDPLCPFRI